MAVDFLTGINLNKNELQNARIQNLATNPTTGLVAGQFYYNTTDNVLRVYNGSTWLDLAISTGTSTITGVTGTNGVSASESGGVVTVQHADTSSVANTSNTSNTVIQNVTFDTFGHVQTISSATISLASLGYTGATNADNYGGFQVSTNSGTSSEVASGGTLNIVGDGVSTSASGLNITLTNVDKGSDQSIFKNVAADGGTNAVADSNNDTLTIAGGDGVTTTGNAASDTISVAVDSTVVRTTGEQNIAGNKNFSNNVTIDGDLTVSGSTITTISETVNVEDSVIYLNSNAPDVPVDDGGMILDRGLELNAGLIWDESEDLFATILTTSDASTSGNTPISSYANLRTGGIQAETLNITNAVAATTDTDSFLVLDGNIVKTRTGALLRQDIGAGTVSSVAISSSSSALNVVSGSPITSSGTINLSLDNSSTDQVGVVELATTAETAALFDTSRAVTPSSLSGLRSKATIGDGVARSFLIEHGLETRDVIIQVVETASPYSTVFPDVERTSTAEVTVSFAAAPSSNQYRVLIYKV